MIGHLLQAYGLAIISYCYKNTTKIYFNDRIDAFRTTSSIIFPPHCPCYALWRSKSTQTIHPQDLLS